MARKPKNTPPPEEENLDGTSHEPVDIDINQLEDADGDPAQAGTVLPSQNVPVEGAAVGEGNETGGDVQIGTVIQPIVVGAPVEEDVATEFPSNEEPETSEEELKRRRALLNVHEQNRNPGNVQPGADNREISPGMFPNTLSSEFKRTIGPPANKGDEYA